nr:site-specific integrase [uncultured Prevotella sp.]
MSRNKKTSESLFQFMNLLIALLLKNGQYRTMLHYKATLNSFKRYRDNKDIALREIDAEVMRSYEAYLHHTAGVCKNTSSFYLRILRSTYNKAVAKGLTPQLHPFTDVYTGIAPTRKRAIPAESVSRIKHLESVKDLTPKEEVARDTFLMSFYLRGISFIDLAHLRKSDLKDGYLHYTRSKTGQRLTIRWEKEMQEVLEKYQAQTASSPYLFPFLVDAGNKSHDKTIDKKQEEVRLYHNAESRISYHLRKLGAKIGIKGKLTLYVARHSWATAARDNNISISVISESLGHHSETTTQIYLRSIKSSEVDDANAKILAVL